MVFFHFNSSRPPVIMALVVSQQAQSICMTFVQCWPNIENVGPTLYTCPTNVVCLLGYLTAFAPSLKNRLHASIYYASFLSSR